MNTLAVQGEFAKLIGGRAENNMLFELLNGLFADMQREMSVKRS
jgi:hypothetical protein